MSTVNKITADEVIAGKYTDDAPVVAIVKYSNVFNGADAYKLCYDQGMLDYCMDNPSHMRNCEIYWRAA